MTAEERFQKIDEDLLVQSHLVAASERETKARLEAAQAQADRHARHVADFRVQTVEFRPTVARLLDVPERFIGGRSCGDAGGL
jgi:nucleotide-binding universal stress UspA family protein